MVEGPTAGGHNAPPRGKLELDASGQPVYGPRDRVDLAKLVATGVPFWMAGCYNAPAQVRFALEHGATGVQVGTPFALCDESGMRPDLKEQTITLALQGALEVRTDPLASPSGYPFKVVGMTDTVSETDVYEGRERVCDVGLLRSAYKQDDGGVGWRCAAEPVKVYVSKGGLLEDTVGRKCLCLLSLGPAASRSIESTCGDRAAAPLGMERSDRVCACRSARPSAGLRNCAHRRTPLRHRVVRRRNTPGRRLERPLHPQRRSRRMAAVDRPGMRCLNSARPGSIMPGTRSSP